MVEWFVVVFVILPLAVVGLTGLVAGVMNGDFEMFAIGAGCATVSWFTAQWSGILDKY